MVVSIKSCNMLPQKHRYDMKILEAGTGAMLGIEFGSLEWLSKAVLIFLWLLLVG